ncbi:MAG: hypothetical protein IKX60_02115 [Bacteroidales bacterium]|nr:hypothetical protein [Bacteroidales bacterium]
MKRLLTILSSISLLLVAGCHPEPFLTVNPTSLSFSQDGGSQTVKVSANYPWTAYVSGPGLTVDPSSGEGEATVTVTAMAAGSTSEISGSITFRSEGLYAVTDIKQEAKSAIIVGDAAKIPFDGGTFKLDIEYNTEYAVEIDKSAQSWITFNGTKAMSSGKLEFSFAYNGGRDARSGKITVTDKSGKADPVSISFMQEGRPEEEWIKDALMKIYDAMDGPNWRIERKWDRSNDLNRWQGVKWKNGELELTFNGDFGLKGEFPDVFEDLTSCVRFWVQSEPGVTGTLPPSFSKLKNLGLLIISKTSMTSLPDIFSGMPLWCVGIDGNGLMEGPIPETLGESDGFLRDGKIDGIRNARLDVECNGFTGDLPESWLRLGTRVSIYGHKLNGEIPDYFYTADNAGYWINLYMNEGYYFGDFRQEHPFSVKDYDIPAYWPDREINDVITGKPIPYDEIVSGNKATVIIKWASWCGFSAALLPRLKKMYEKYHDDGLEIIARPGWGDDEGINNQKDFLKEKGYDKWYNFSSDDIGFDEAFAMGEHGTPYANVVDNKGNIIFATVPNVDDPSRNRFSHVAFTELIPFLEGIFGPLDDDDDYSSTDYSMDGDVITLQKATVGKGINILFLGDAYTDRDMTSGLYEQLMRQCMEEFFAIEPYKTFRDRFNVYSVKVVSKNGRTGNGYNTALGAIVDGTTISISNAGVEKSYEYALKVPGIKDKNNLMIGVLVNSVGRRGITSMSQERQSGVAFYASVSNNAEVFGPMIRHEAGGHGFAFLADEYSDQSGSPSQELVDTYNRLYQDYGWYSNVDFTNDPAKIKWSAFLSDERYKGKVGIFEGGAGYYTKDVWRPSEDSMMNQEAEYYNAPSRWAIYQRIMKLSGEECSFEKFLEYDEVNRKASPARTSVKPPFKAPGWQPGAPPVVMP